MEGPLWGVSHGPDGPPALLPARPLTQGDLAALTERVRRRVIGWFKRKGFLDAHAAAAMLAWENSGFSIDASVRITLLDRDVPSYFQSIEHLLRYCARPPFALERLSVIRDADSRIARIRSVMPRHKAANWVGPGRKRGRSFPSSARRAAATSGSEQTAGRSRLPSNRRFASGSRPGWLRPREVSPSPTSANRLNRRRSLPLAGRPPTGLSSSRCTTTGTSFRRNTTSCLRSTSTRCEPGVACRLIPECGEGLR